MGRQPRLSWETGWRSLEVTDPGPQPGDVVQLDPGQGAVYHGLGDPAAEVGVQQPLELGPRPRSLVLVLDTTEREAAGAVGAAHAPRHRAHGCVLHAGHGAHEHAVLHGGPVAEVDEVAGGDEASASLAAHLIADVGGVVDQLQDPDLLQGRVPPRQLLHLVVELLQQQLGGNVQVTLQIG